MDELKYNCNMISKDPNHMNVIDSPYLNQKFHYLCKSMNIKNTKPIYEMILTVINENIFQEFPFDDLKIIIAALFYLNNIKLFSYEHTCDDIYSKIDNGLFSIDQFASYVELFSNVFKVTEMTEDEARFGVLRVLSIICEHLKAHTHFDEVTMSDIYNIKDIAKESADGEYDMSLHQDLTREKSQDERFKSWKKIYSDLNKVLLNQINAKQDEIINTSLEIFSFIEANDTLSNLLDEENVTPLEHRTLLVPTIVFIAAAAHKLPVSTRYLVEPLNLERKKFIYYSNVVTLRMKKQLISRFKYPIDSISIFLIYIKTLRTRTGEAEPGSEKEELGSMEVSLNDVMERTRFKKSLESKTIFEILFHQKEVVPEKVVNDMIDDILDLLISEASRHNSYCVNHCNSLFFTENEIERYVYLCSKFYGKINEIKFYDVSIGFRIYRNDYILLYKLISMYRVNIVSICLILINISSDYEYNYIRRFREENLSIIRRFFLRYVILISMRCIKIPISTYISHIYQKESTGSFYKCFRKVMIIFSNIFKNKYKCSITTMKDFLTAIIRGNNLERFVIDVLALKKLIKKNLNPMHFEDYQTCCKILSD